MSPKSRPPRHPYRGAKAAKPQAPGSVNPAGFEVLAVRSVLNPVLPPSLMVRHTCGWSEEITRQEARMDELVGLVAAHSMMGCV